MTSIKLEFDKKNADILIWRGQIVMSRTEEPYFKALFSRLAYLKPYSVLEIGFGLGISAGLIQKYMSPQLHDIYEIERSIYTDLERFAEEHPSVRPHLGDWKRCSITQQYDFIFFDPFHYSVEETLDEDVSHEEWSTARAENAERMRGLLSERGILCHPHFGDGEVPDLPGFTTTIVERLKVSSIRMSDETSCEDAAVVFHQPIRNV